MENLFGMLMEILDFSLKGLFYQLKKNSEWDEGDRHCNEYGTCDDIESDSDEY